MLTNFKKSIIKKAIKEEYKKLNGSFQLFIEDEAPAEINYAGKKSNRKEISFDDLPEFVKRKLGAALFGSDVMGLTCPIEGISQEASEEYSQFICDSIYLFVEPIVAMGKVIGLHRVIKEVVRHEYRHSCQFIWCRKNGVSVIDALMKENEAEYGQGILESDAVSFQKGIVNDLNEVMKSFIK